MPFSERFRTPLDTCFGRPFSGRCFRIVELESYISASTPALLFDLGPKIAKGGQRFSPSGDHRGLYVSTELVTAGAEFAGSRHAWQAGNCCKHVVFDMDVKLASVLDLTDAKIRRTLRTSRAEILSPWKGFSALRKGKWPATWTLGHHAFASGKFDGILFPSNRNSSGTCLLVFTERLIGNKAHVIIHKQDGNVWERLP